MKSKFPGYFKLSDDEITELWKDAIFVLDANILLNLYRYSDDTREKFFEILEKLEEKVWIPHQSASEYFENRLNVISEQEKSYDKAIKTLDEIENDFKSSRQHPFVSEESLNKLSALKKEICAQLSESKNFHHKRILEDDVLNRIETLFDDKVGDEFEEKDLNSICEEGKERFESKIPPGYKDINKEGDRKYGDLILWKQIINKSIQDQKNVILILDDKKEDWWVRFNGKTLTPRPELKKEFKGETNQQIHMYQSDRFLEYAGNFLKAEINERFITEVRELRELDEKMRLEKESFAFTKRKQRIKNGYLFSNEIREIKDKLLQLNEKLNLNIDMQREFDSENSGIPPWVLDDILEERCFILNEINHTEDMLIQKKKEQRVYESKKDKKWLVKYSNRDK